MKMKSDRHGNFRGPFMLDWNAVYRIKSPKYNRKYHFWPKDNKKLLKTEVLFWKHLLIKLGFRGWNINWNRFQNRKNNSKCSFRIFSISVMGLILPKKLMKRKSNRSENLTACCRADEKERTKSYFKSLFESSILNLIRCLSLRKKDKIDDQ